ncbi:MAG: ABC transporter permease subunit, partial [Myxococcota bacterium]
WVAVALAVVPPLVALAVGQPEAARWRELFGLSIAAMEVMAALFLASALSDEIDNQTYTYLWSRPLPRWSVVAGKLIAQVPVVAALMTVSVALTFVISFGQSSGAHLDLLGGSVLAMVLGSITAGVMCIGIGTVLTRQATPVALIYLLIGDAAVGTLPFAVRNMSIRYHIDRLAMGGPDAVSLAWLLDIAVIWLAIALWRVRRAEFGGAR